MDIADVDIDSLKDLDSEEEDPEFHKFLSEIIDGKKFPKIRNSEKKEKSKGLMQDAYQLYYENKNDEAMEKVKEAIISSPDSSAPFHLMSEMMKEYSTDLDLQRSSSPTQKFGSDESLSR